MIALMLRAVVVVCGVGLWVACDRSGGPDGGAPPVASAPERDGAMRSGPRAPGPEDHQMKGPLPDPHVPQRADAFSPALTQLAEPGPPNLEVLSERESCAQCHAGIVSEWQESMHAFSSMNNPFYVVSFDPFVADSGHTKGRFCNGCHEPAFLFKETPATIEPTDPLAYAGVGCGTCHGAVEATSDGNASYTLTTQPVPVPKPGDDASLAAHRARVGADTLRSDALCVSCHRAFLSPDTGHDVFVNGADEFGPWRRSAYAGSRATRIDAPAESHSCTSCHMPKAKGAVSSTMTGTKSHASHRFPGGHTTMAHGLGADLQMEAVEAMLRSAATLDIVALASNNPKGVLAPVVGSAGVDGPAEMKVSPKRPLAFDVVIFNKGVGHQFPGGVRDLRDTWVEVVVEDAAGQVVAQSGVDHAQSGSEKGVFRLRALLLSNAGDAVFEHEVAQFRTAVFDRTVGPRDSAIARYTWTPQAPLAAERMPLTIRARLRHRRLQKAIHARACASASTPRGKAFVKGAKRHNGLRPDPCLEQPVLDLATRRLQVGAGAQAPSYAADRPVWMRLLQHGQGLTHHVQERLDEALMSLTKAASVLPDDAPVWAKAAVLLEQARVLGRQGRTDDAVALLEKVEVLKPNHPASARVRAESYAQVWRWAEAAEAWIQVTQHAPRDDRGWRGLAIALGSLGKREAALTAAQTGLALEPRDAHLLRSQSLAFARLAPDSEKADVAHEVWMQYRRDEASPGIKGRCADPDSDCQFERVPIPERALKTAVLP